MFVAPRLVKTATGTRFPFIPHSFITATTKYRPVKIFTVSLLMKIRFSQTDFLSFYDRQQNIIKPRWVGIY
jgi:hypothetical protein